MNLLVFNIRTDADHPTQGVTTRWLNELSKHFDHLYVITMNKGRMALRGNIDVYSVGGERSLGRVKKGVAFYRHLFRVLKGCEIHGCFAHMAVLFVLLGGPVLRWRNVPIIMWYAHSVINPAMVSATWFSRRIITASPDSFRYKSGKVRITGHGIDTEHYSRKPCVKGQVFRIGSVGRISRVKDYETLLQAVHLLKKEGIVDFEVHLYGNVQTPSDREYQSRLLTLVKSLALRENVAFPGPLTGDQVPEVVSGFDVFVNMLSRGGAGKAVLEAMSIECPTLICTPAFNRWLSRDDQDLLVFKAGDPVSLKERLKGIMTLSEDDRRRMGRRLRQIVVQGHSLKALAERIRSIVEECME